MFAQQAQARSGARADAGADHRRAQGVGHPPVGVECRAIKGGIYPIDWRAKVLNHCLHIDDERRRATDRLPPAPPPPPAAAPADDLEQRYDAAAGGGQAKFLRDFGRAPPAHTRWPARRG